MNTATVALIDFVTVIVFIYSLYISGRIFIPPLAEKDVFVSGPKLGRIKARIRSGRIIGFIDNLVGKGRHTNRITGKIETGEFTPKNIWWKLFGVYFIGLDEVARYNIAVEATESADGSLTYLEKEASSIFLEGSYPITAKFVTSDGIRLRIKLQLLLITVDAAKALSLPVSWTIPVFTAVLGTGRDFCGTRSIRTLIATKNEGAEVTPDINNIRNSDLVREILGLNVPKFGNVSLLEICGQQIGAVNMLDVDFADEETRRAFSAPFIAEQEAQKQIKEAEAYARAVSIRTEADKKAASNIASAITLKGVAEAGVYIMKYEGLGKNANATAQVITAEKQGDMDNLTTLVNGGNTTMALPVNNK